MAVLESLQLDGLFFFTHLCHWLAKLTERRMDSFLDRWLEARPSPKNYWRSQGESHLLIHPLHKLSPLLNKSCI